MSEVKTNYCILLPNNQLVDGANGWAIGKTEKEAWERALCPCEDWSIKKAKEIGYYVAECTVNVINANNS